MFEYKGKVLGISTDETETWLKEHVSELASSTGAKLGRRIDFKPDEVLANANYCSAGYGVVTEREREAIRLFATYEGLLLDPVYTGRAAAGMIDLIRKGFFKEERDCLVPAHRRTAGLVRGSIREHDLSIRRQLSAPSN